MPELSAEAEVFAEVGFAWIEAVTGLAMSRKERDEVLREFVAILERRATAPPSTREPRRHVSAGAALEIVSRTLPRWLR